MDNAYLEIENKEVEVCLDRAGHIDGFMIDGEPVDMRIDSPDTRLILEHMVEIEEETSCVIREWRSRYVANRAYWGEG